MQGPTCAVLQGRSNAPDRGSGFTLVEILVTMLVLTIALLGLAALQISTIRNVTGARQASEATRLAYNVVERYQAETPANLPAPTAGWVVVRNANGADMGGVGVDGISTGPFTVQQLVEDAVGTVSGERVINVRVTWLETTPSGPANATAVYRTRDVTLTIRRYL